MLKVENVETYGWEAAIRGMRNPMNSWEKSDSMFDIEWLDSCLEYSGHTIRHETPGIPNDWNEGDKNYIGFDDRRLMRSLAKAGPVHAKFRRMLTITMDITGPLYWWKEFDTYKVGTVANSCSTMHKIAAKPFELDDFSCEHLFSNGAIIEPRSNNNWDAMGCLLHTIDVLNYFRDHYLMHKDKKYWWQLIQLLPSSYNQKRTVQLNYEVAHNIYISRKDHRLDEWHTLCNELAKLPMSELITGEEK